MLGKIKLSVVLALIVVSAQGILLLALEMASGEDLHLQANSYTAIVIAVLAAIAVAVGFGASLGKSLTAVARFLNGSGKVATVPRLNSCAEIADLMSAFGNFKRASQTLLEAAGASAEQSSRAARTLAESSSDGHRMLE